MPESLDTLLGRTTNPFIPLNLGDMTLGWFAPHLDVGNGECFWFVAVGDTVFTLNLTEVTGRCMEFGLQMPTGIPSVMGFEADLIFQAPAGAVDIGEDNLVACTERTMENLLNMFANFKPVLKSGMQALLNNETASEAAKTYVKLLQCGYPYAAELKWHGESLFELDAFYSELLGEMQFFGGKE